MLTDSTALLTSSKYLLHLPPTSTDTAPHMEYDRFTSLSLSRFLTKTAGYLKKLQHHRRIMETLNKENISRPQVQIIAYKGKLILLKQISK